MSSFGPSDVIPDLEKRIKQCDVAKKEYERIIELLTTQKNEVDNAKTKKAKNYVWKILSGDEIARQFRNVDKLIEQGNNIVGRNNEYGRYYHDNVGDWKPGTEAYLSKKNYSSGRTIFSFENFISYLDTYHKFLVKNILLVEENKKNLEEELEKEKNKAAAAEAGEAEAAGGNRKQKRSLCRRTVRRGGKSSKKRNKGRRKMKSKRGVPIQV